MKIKRILIAILFLLGMSCSLLSQAPQTVTPLIPQTGATSETSRLSQARYTAGIDSYLSVLDAQRSLYAAQQGLIALRQARIGNLISLYKVLGGGWKAS